MNKNINILTNLRIETENLVLESEKNNEETEGIGDKITINILKKEQNNLRKHKKIIGNITLIYIDKRAEVKIFINEECQNLGYATEALNKIIEHLKNISPKYKIKLFGKASLEQIAFARVLVKCGFSYQEKTNEFIYKDRK